MKQLIQHQRGFTLIESIVYLALFTLIIGGGMAATYQIIAASDAAFNHIILNQEANFLIKKMNWALRGATAISASGSTLAATNTVSGVSTQLTFTHSGSQLMLQRGSAAATALNSSNVTVNWITFAKTAGSGGMPDKIDTNFSLTTATAGAQTSQTFSTTHYVR